METDEAFAWPEGWEKAIPAVTRLVQSICRRSRNLSQSDADDILQVALMRLLLEASSRKRHFASLPELCGWVSCFVRSQLNKRGKRRSLEAVARGVSVTTLPDVGDATTDVEDISVYVALLDDPRDRQVLALRYAEGFGFEKIAERLGSSTAQAHKLHERAIEKLRRRLSQ